MKALVYTAPHRVELQELPVPKLQPHEYLVAIRAVGICGSDLAGFLGKSEKRVPPLVLGHEFCGEIVQAGDRASGFKVGERVAVYPLVTCGKCRYCQSRRHQICPNRRIYGLEFHGGLAEYVAAPAECLFRMPPTMSFVEGAVVEPLANAIHALRRIGSVQGQTGLVYGAGPIGALTCWAAKRSGAQRVAVLDVNPKRLDRLEELGADLLVNPAEQDAVTVILDWAGDPGVDFAVDAVGRAECRRKAISCMAPGGVVLWIGLAEAGCEMDGRAIVAREIEVRGSYAYGLDDFQGALTLLAQGVFPVKSFVTESRLEHAPQVFEDLAGGHSALMKVIFLL